MCLPNSLPISASQVNVELGRASNAAFDMLGAAELALAGQASAPNSMSNFIGKCNQGASYIGNFLVNTGPGTTLSGSIDIGSPDSRRRVVIVVHWSLGSSSVALSSATINGVAATIHKQNSQSGGSTGLGVAIISAIVPTGSTSVTLSATWAASVSLFEAGVWSLINYNTLVAAQSATSNTTAVPISTSVTTSAGGIVIAGYTGSSNTVGVSVTWTNVTKMYDVGIGTRDSGAWVTGLSAGSLTVGGSQGTITNAGNGLIVTSWAI